MNTLDLSKTDFEALLQLAESQFYAWHLREIRPERERRINELKKQNLTIGGQAVNAIRIYRELLEREVRQRIGFYVRVAHDSGNREMLSKPRLDEYKMRVMTTVGQVSMALKDHIERDAHAAGWPESSLPMEHRYVQLQSEILNVVNAELRVLEAEGNLRDRGTYPPPVAPTDASKGMESASQNSPQPQGPKRSRKAENSVRRNIKYEGIDRALSGISEARPKNHEEVFRFLDDRNVAIPNRKPFKAAGGWLKGFQQNRHAASAWLSQAWGRLDLPAFARGPKK